MVEPRHLDQLLHPALVRTPQQYAPAVLARGLAASPGAAVGRLVFTAEAAEAWHKVGDRCTEHQKQQQQQR